MGAHDPIILNPGPKGAAIITPTAQTPRVFEALDRECLDELGFLRPVPARFYADFSQADIALWCHHRAFYYLPTIEALDWVRALLPEDLSKALEIGSGNGCLGRGLGIRTTDNRQQERGEIAKIYADRGHATVNYGWDVEELSALQAVEKYEPEVVVAAWVTHRSDPARPKLGGNPHGVDEKKLLGKKSVRRYVFFGHEAAHRDKPIMSQRHQTWELPFLYSRALQPGKNVVWVWEA